MNFFAIPRYLSTLLINTEKCSSLSFNLNDDSQSTLMEEEEKEEEKEEEEMPLSLTTPRDGVKGRTDGAVRKRADDDFVRKVDQSDSMKPGRRKICE